MSGILQRYQIIREEHPEMKNMTVVILEKSRVYGERLAGYISRREDSPFNVTLYLTHPVSAEQLKKADVIVMSSFLEDIYGSGLLPDRERLFILDEEGENGENDSETESVYKYQSASFIYDKLVGFALDRSGKHLIGNGGMHKDTEIVAVYIPVCGQSQSAAVTAWCRRAASERKVLYLNLWPVSIFGGFGGGEEENYEKDGITELIYYAKQGVKHLGSLTEKMAVKGKPDYLLPARSPADIYEMKGSEWEECIARIREETDYDMIVMDYGPGMPGAEVLDMCGKVLTVSSGSEWEEKMIAQFADRAGQVTESCLSDKIERTEAVLRRTEGRM